MPVFIGDVLESCGGPILDLAGNKVKGVGIFENTGARNDLDAEFRTSGYLSVVDGDLEVYSGVTWDSANSWTKIASEFSLYSEIYIPDESVDNASKVRASAFVGSIESTPERYSFGIYDSVDDQFRKISGETLNDIIIHVFGEQLAIHLAETTGNGTTYYTDPTTGIVGDLTADGTVSVADILLLLGGFGTGVDNQSRDYSINLGQTYWSGQGASEPLVGSQNTGVATSPFTDLDSWGNNISVTGDQLGDDITFDVVPGSPGNPRIVLEHLDASGVNVNLISFLVDAQGNVPTSQVTSGSSQVELVTHSISLNQTAVESESTITVATATTASTGISSAPVELRLRISLMGPDDTTVLSPSGNTYMDLTVGTVYQGAQEEAGTFSLMSDQIYGGNIIQELINFYSLSIDQVVHKIRFVPHINNNIIGFFYPGDVTSFEIENLKIKVVGGGATG